MRRIVNEGLDYHDFANQITPVISIDEYSAKTGEDDEIVTLAFTVKGEKASNDLVEWFERGYDFVLDAQVSDGEVNRGKYLVFVEMNRRTRAPQRIVELLEDLKTLTDLKLADWTARIEDEEYDIDEETLSQHMILSPHEYRKLKEKDLNEMRELSGVQPHDIFDEQDSEIKSFKSLAGL
jgi:hypothetical protein